MAIGASRGGCFQVGRRPSGFTGGSELGRAGFVARGKRVQDFEGRTAVVTGGASGMGLAFASAFARLGMNVALADIEEGALRKAAGAIESLGVGVVPVVTDVGDGEAMDHLADVTRTQFGVPDVVCLNAGVTAPSRPVDQLTTNDWKWVFDVNLWGVVHGLRVFLPEMKAHDEGHVVMTASVAGLTSFPLMAPYNATKHAVVTIAETLFAELRNEGSGVHVHCLCPGAVSTNIAGAERNRPKSLANAEEERTASSDTSAQELDALTERLRGLSKTPEEVAELVVEAIVEGRFWIETDVYYREAIQARHRAIETRIEPPIAQSVADPYLKATEEAG
jgi:NAD(P)-dependent dehydrogenase (short-subunit alcohol dehydrogenase family)